MPKPTIRLFMMAKNLGAAMKAVNKGDSSFLSGMKIADNVKMPTVMKKPVVADHPLTKEMKLLSVEVPRSSVKFDRPDSRIEQGVMEEFKSINDKGGISLFPNIDRRQFSSEGLMSVELFKSMAKQGKVKIHKEPPVKVPEPEIPHTVHESVMPHSFKTQILSGIKDSDVFKKSDQLLDTSIKGIGLKLTPRKKGGFKLAENTVSPELQEFNKAWSPHFRYISFISESLRTKRLHGDKDFSGKLNSEIAQSIREVTEKMLPIAEPRKRGVNKNLVYRRIFKGPKENG